MDKLAVLKGTLDMLVLKTLSWGPMHGFEIMTWLEDGTQNGLDIEDAALYQALRRMEERGLVQAEMGLTENNRRARYYQLTPRGEEHLRNEAARWLRYADMVGALLARTVPGSVSHAAS